MLGGGKGARRVSHQVPCRCPSRGTAREAAFGRPGSRRGADAAGCIASCTKGSEPSQGPGCSAGGKNQQVRGAHVCGAVAVLRVGRSTRGCRRGDGCASSRRRLACCRIATRLLEREAEAAMLHDTASSGQALATDSKQRIKDLESQVQALRWKMAMAGMSSSVPDTKPGDTNTALANVLGMSPAVVTTPAPSRSPRPRATAPSSQPLMSTPSRATATRSVASGKSTGGGRGSLAQQAEHESLHMMAHNILNNSTTEPGGRVAALRKAAARIAAGQSPLPDGAGLDTAIARRSGGAASYQSPTQNGSASGRRYRYS